MENLIIAASNVSPKVDFNVSTCKMVIEGFSVMEDSRSFYKNLINWVKNYSEVISSDLKVECNFTEMNQASLKMLLFFCQELKAIQIAGNKVELDWIYQSGDHQMKEFGQDLSYMSDLQFHFCSVKEPSLV